MPPKNQKLFYVAAAQMAVGVAVVGTLLEMALTGKR